MSYLDDVTKALSANVKEKLGGKMDYEDFVEQCEEDRDMLDAFKIKHSQLIDEIAVNVNNAQEAKKLNELWNYTVQWAWENRPQNDDDPREER